jgi:hypothetical protein
MENSENMVNDHEDNTPSQSDNNAGTIGQEGGLPNRPEQKPFTEQDNPHDIETGNKEYDRHHKEDHVHTILPVSAEEEIAKGEINNDLPGNQPGNVMHVHAENNRGDSIED